MLDFIQKVGENQWHVAVIIHATPMHYFPMHYFPSDIQGQSYLDQTEQSNSE